jgi:ribosome assembly protein YihI (activator of Der GTPase)
MSESKQTLTRLEVRRMYAGLESPSLDSIKCFPLFYAIDRTRRKLKPVYEALSPEKMIKDYDEYNREIRALHESLSEGRTITTRTGEKIWDINYNSNEYLDKLDELKTKYGIKEYDEFINGEFDEDIDQYIHYVNDKEVDPKKDVPDFGTFKLISFLFKNF